MQVEPVKGVVERGEQASIEGRKVVIVEVQPPQVDETVEDAGGQGRDGVPVQQQ